MEQSRVGSAELAGARRRAWGWDFATVLAIASVFTAGRVVNEGWAEGIATLLVGVAGAAIVATAGVVSRRFQLFVVVLALVASVAWLASIVVA